MIDKESLAELNIFIVKINMVLMMVQHAVMDWLAQTENLAQTLFTCRDRRAML